jgi:murein DD-endopeptidase MepM/ murein hydrolase activator NlpD
VRHARPLAARRFFAPVLLVAACTAGFGGLAAATPQGPAVAASSATRPLPPLGVEDLQRERAAVRASRDRRLADQRAAQQAAAAALAAAQAQAQAEAAAAAAAAEAAARAQAQAAAKAAAEATRVAAEAEAEAQRARTACPVPSASFTDTYGAPRSGGRAHQGTDLLAPYGAPVYAVVPGRVRTASSGLGGISLYLDGDNGETYFYAHNSANVARTGQRVAAGDLIAKVGSTGNAGGTNHVHFERQVGGRSVNPYDFLRRIC